MKSKVNEKGVIEFVNGIAIGFVICLLLAAGIFWLSDNMNKKQEMEDRFSMNCPSRRVENIDCISVDISNNTTPIYEKRCYFTCYDGFEFPED